MYNSTISSLIKCMKNSKLLTHSNLYSSYPKNITFLKNIKEVRLSIIYIKILSVYANRVNNTHLYQPIYYYVPLNYVNERYINNKKISFLFENLRNNDNIIEADETELKKLMKEYVIFK